MKALLLLACSAWGLWPFSSRILRPDPLAETAALAEGGRHAEVAARMEETLFRKDLRKEERRRAYLLFGRSLEALGRLDEALSLYQVAVGSFPEDEELVLAEALLFHKVEMDDRARPLFERVLELDEDNALAHIGLAEAYQRLGFLDRSSRHYRLALEGDRRGDPEVWRQYARTSLARRDFPEAEAAAGQALRLAPDAPAWEMLAAARQRRGKADEALAALDEALRLAPDDAALRARKTLWLLKLKRFDEAAAEGGRLWERHPTEPLALWIRAAVRFRQGRLAEAVRDFEQAGQADGFVGRSAREAAKALGAAGRADGGKGRP